MTTQSVSSEITETPQVPVDIFVSQNPNHPVTQWYFTKQASVYVFDAVKQMVLVMTSLAFLALWIIRRFETRT